MKTSFWKNAAASLPPQVRDRYAAHFEAAERYEHVLDFGVGAWRGARRALATGCQTTARGLRAAARHLDGAARHIRANR